LEEKLQLSDPELLLIPGGLNWVGGRSLLPEQVAAAQALILIARLDGKDGRHDAVHRACTMISAP
jgi:hypothetical protein